MASGLRKASSRETNGTEDDVELVRTPSRTSDSLVGDEARSSDTDASLPPTENREDCQSQDVLQRANSSDSARYHDTMSASEVSTSGLSKPGARSRGARSRRSTSFSHRQRGRSESISMGLEVPTNYAGMSESFIPSSEQSEVEDAINEDDEMEVESVSSDDPPDNSM
jgi:hypothetical protein